MINNNLPAKPVYKRQRFLLSFIQSLKEPCTLIDIQKLLFLYSQKQEYAFYDFVPYLYGSYSFQAAEDINTLEKNGWVKKSKNTIHYCFSENKINFDLPFFELNELPSVRGKNLLKMVYQQYPYFALNSKVANTILDKEGLNLVENLRKNLERKEQILFTIGYEGLSIEKYLNMLIQNDIRVLCDVRNNPLSRKFGFSKTNLEHYLKNIGIEYIHIPELGIVSGKRKNLETDLDYKELFMDYKKSLSNRKKFIMQVYQILSLKKRVALTCFEHDPEHCHRHIISHYMCEQYDIVTEDL
jgi:uncharacterized protein (DUF488 family)